MKKLLILALLLGTAACGSKPAAENSVANTAIPAENVAEPAPVVPPPGNDTAPAADYASPKTPTPILQIECRQGECNWEQITSIEILRNSKGEVLKKVVSRRGTSLYDTDGPAIDVPEGYDKSIEINWEPDPRTEFVLCSKTRPTEAGWDKDEETHLITTLNVISPAGYEMSGVTYYMQICHNLAPGKWSADDLRRLGYGEIKSDQRQIDTIDEVMKFLE
jgi:hypothetical protein